AFEIVKELETASISLLQRRLRIGYNRAANIMDDLEANGIVSEQDGSKPRDVLIPSTEEENEPFNSETTQTEQ
ncbi:MAG TPA: DNA translocase FtsK, partial [Atopostipes sp.]|nr:DNA translocase FtsK [Atopostipes sp.]